MLSTRRELKDDQFENPASKKKAVGCEKRRYPAEVTVSKSSEISSRLLLAFYNNAFESGSFKLVSPVRFAFIN